MNRLGIVALTTVGVVALYKLPLLSYLQLPIPDDHQRRGGWSDALRLKRH